ncbi:Coatomer subunit gamma-2 [Cyanidiococcus yangmingshanensis]|uniref:Coatomer subunit gamma n=1 Tax=Cyanidiococcus yangmingshanensis TaxID=2690220 RepID=A0A7J7IN56_9RHOD|nr:Coatomer subunit gamma-2 [Cyanidiococcus yangmingshanensis]
MSVSGTIRDFAEDARSLLQSLGSKIEEDGINPLAIADKAKVVQQVRVFNETRLRPAHCLQVLTRLMFLVNQGERLTPSEATEIFFASTKLFSSDDAALRRMTYLAIKELAHTAEEVIIVVNCLTKDVTSTIDNRRANALRVLCKIMDATMVAQVERYVRQALVDRNPNVASAALLSAQAFLQAGKAESVVRRWLNEATQALSHPYPIVQYHALSLLYAIKCKDRQAVSKLVQDVARQGVRSPLSAALLLRYIGEILDIDVHLDEGTRLQYLSFVESMLRHRSELVVVEAARVLCAVRSVQETTLQTASSALQMLLISTKPVVRYAAARTLCQIAMLCPAAVAPLNHDIENLIADPNRAVATAAVTTLLRTGTEISVDRLLQSVTRFLHELGDDFKVTVIQAIRTLTLKYPHKHSALVRFLGEALRGEGGLCFKQAIVDTFRDLIEKMPECASDCLGHLTELLEDCEFPALSVQVLHMLGERGPETPTPSCYVRSIYNRIILESPVVRAAAVSALARFAAVPDLSGSVQVLLRQCLLDSDDEVRDRAAFALEALGEHVEASEPLSRSSSCAESPTDRKLWTPVTLDVPIESLEKALVEYLRYDLYQHGPFDLNTARSMALIGSTPGGPSIQGQVSLTDAQADSRMSAANRVTDAGVAIASAASMISAPSNVSGTAVHEFRTVLFANEALRALGFVNAPFKSSRPFDLTDSEAEFLVTGMKHVYPNALVIQFRLTNTLEDQQLQTCVVELDTKEIANLVVREHIPAPVVKFGEPNWCFVILENRDADAELLTPDLGLLPAKLVYHVTEVDPWTKQPQDEHGFADTFVLEELEIELKDYIQPLELPEAFELPWTSMETTHATITESFVLPHETVADAAVAVAEYLGMHACDESLRVAPNASQHMLLLAGVFLGGFRLLIQGRFSKAMPTGVQLDLAVRSENEQVSELVASCIA